MKGAGLIFDLIRCVGCDACAAACRDEHLVPFDTAWLSVVKTQCEVDSERVFEHRLCLHCDPPACLDACTEDALFQDEDRVVQMQGERCTGCGDCVEACPYDSLAVSDEGAVLPSSYLLLPRQEVLRQRRLEQARRHIPTKCDLCAERRKEGRPPACVAACSVHAISFDLIDPEDGVRVRFVRP